MSVNPSEVSHLIQERISEFDASPEARTEGTIISIKDGILRIHGLHNAMQFEMLELPGDVYGLVLNLEKDSVGAVVLGDYKHLREGQIVKCTGKMLEVPIGEELLGRVVNPLGEPIDGKGPIGHKNTAAIEKVAPGVIERQPVTQPMQTGLKSIDASCD